MNSPIKTVILGGSGYVAGELLRLIATHPELQFAAAVSDSRSQLPIADTFGHLGSAYPGDCYVGHGDWIDLLDVGDRIALFSAAPHGASAALLERAFRLAAAKDVAVHAVDCSADFRYAMQGDYEAVYGAKHGAPDLLPSFSSGLPEHVSTVETDHVGNPGCFATAALLATVPLMQSGLTDGELYVTGITGSTGSGRNPVPGTHHPERHSNLYAYKPLRHRHAPEIAAMTTAASGRDAQIHFVPHSGPFARGIHVTVMARAKRRVSEKQLLHAFEEVYTDSPFVNIGLSPPRLKSVVASNYCQIGVACDADSVVVMSVIDNLVKGAAGGAIQWMNRLWGLPETSGLLAAAPGWT
jgi:N-acetyl-gamma-glutamyl-phosphate reductase